MARESELVRLEQYIERLLMGYGELKTERQRLMAELSRSKNENEQLRHALESRDVERGEVCDRVTSLIERIEQWESELPESESLQPGTHENQESAEESPSPRNATSSAGSAEPEEPDDETEPVVEDDEPVSGQKDARGGGVQGNLFSSG